MMKGLVTIHKRTRFYPEERRRSTTYQGLLYVLMWQYVGGRKREKLIYIGSDVVFFLSLFTLALLLMAGGAEKEVGPSREKEDRKQLYEWML